MVLHATAGEGNCTVAVPVFRDTRISKHTGAFNQTSVGSTVFCLVPGQEPFSVFQSALSDFVYAVTPKLQSVFILCGRTTNKTF